MKNIVKALELLAVDYHVILLNLLNFHWNVKGKHFFVIHEQLEKYYKDTLEELDEIVERIHILGEKFELDLKLSLSKSTLEVGSSSGEDKIVSKLLKDYSTIIGQLKAISRIAAEKEDAGTVVLTDELTSKIEKRVWMLSSFSQR